MQISNQSNRTKFSMLPHIVMEWPGITPSAKNLYWYFSLVCGNDSGTCWASLETIAKGCGMCRKTIITTRDLLEKIGLIIVTRTPRSNGTTQVNVALIDVWEANKDHVPYHMQRDTQVTNLQPGSVDFTPPQVTNLHHPSNKFTTGQVENLHPNKNNINKNNKEESGLRNPDSACEDFGLTKKKNNSDSTPKLDKFCTKAGQYLWDAVAGVMHLNKKSTPLKFGNDIKLLREKDGVPEAQIKKIMKWYAKNIGKPYVPQCLCGASFREKFDKLQIAILRQEQDVTTINENGNDEGPMYDENVSEAEMIACFGADFNKTPPRIDTHYDPDHPEDEQDGN